MKDPAPSAEPDHPQKGRTWKRAGRWALEGLLIVVMVASAMLIMGRWRAPDLPEQAPAFRLPDLEGRMVELEDFRGQTVVLNFWATW